MQVWVSFQEFIGVNANFNFYLDRREFQKLHGKLKLFIIIPQLLSICFSL